MRFPQLKIGQQFEFQGKRYTKTGPLTASEEATGASTMIRRSAEVTVVESTANGALEKQLKQNFSREEVIELCRGYRTRLTQESQAIADENGFLQIDQLHLLLKDHDLIESLL
jgi:hypothetical protein